MRKRTARDHGYQPIPPEALEGQIGCNVHVAWAAVGCKWNLVRVDGEIATLRTPIGGKTLRVNVRDLMYTQRNEPREAREKREAQKENADD